MKRIKNRLIFIFLISPLWCFSQTNRIAHSEDDGNQRHTYASLFPVDKAALSSQMTGVIQKIYYRPGDVFKEGDILVQFNCEEVDLKANRAQAELEAAEVELKSMQELTQLNSASKLDLAKAQSAYKIAKADLRIINFQQKQCQIIAPYNGEVVHWSAAENETVKTDDPLIDIISNGNLEVKMYIPSLWLADVKKGTTFDLVLDEIPAHKLQGNVVKIVGQIDPASQSILVYGVIDYSKEKQALLQDRAIKLFSGMSGMAYFDKVQGLDKQGDVR
jgi:RND family efflux transporter MFP subunit